MIANCHSSAERVHGGRLFSPSSTRNRCSQIDGERRRLSSTRSLFDETIAEAADSLDVLGSRAQFIAQSAHVSVHGARVGETLVFPYIAQQLVAGLYETAPLCQECDQLEFDCGQVDLVAVDCDFMPGNVH